MADTSFHPQPQNPNAFDFHAYYGGDKGQHPHLTHGHIHITHHGVQYHRPPGAPEIGSLALRAAGIPRP
jgi:hypothetical protein